MTAVVVFAKDYAAAATAAAQLGLGQDWVYPHDPDRLRGMAIDRVVWVDGWEASRAITPQAGAVAIARMTANASERFVRLQAPQSFPSPFVETVAPVARNVQHGQGRRRRGILPTGYEWLWVATIGAIASTIVLWALSLTGVLS